MCAMQSRRREDLWGFFEIDKLSILERARSIAESESNRVLNEAISARLAQVFSGATAPPIPRFRERFFNPFFDLAPQYGGYNRDEFEDLYVEIVENCVDRKLRDCVTRECLSRFFTVQRGYLKVDEEAVRKYSEECFENASREVEKNIDVLVSMFKEYAEARKIHSGWRSTEKKRGKTNIWEQRYEFIKLTNDLGWIFPVPQMNLTVPVEGADDKYINARIEFVGLPSRRYLDVATAGTYEFMWTDFSKINTTALDELEIRSKRADPFAQEVYRRLLRDMHGLMEDLVRKFYALAMVFASLDPSKTSMLEGIENVYFERFSNVLSLSDEELKLVEEWVELVNKIKWFIGELGKKGPSILPATNKTEYVDGGDVKAFAVFYSVFGGFIRGFTVDFFDSDGYLLMRMQLRPYYWKPNELRCSVNIYFFDDVEAVRAISGLLDELIKKI